VWGFEDGGLHVVYRKRLTKDHKCNVVGCTANAGQNCTHNVNKCINCKRNHIGKANCCVKKQKAIKQAREEWQTWKEREGQRRNVTTDQQKEPQQTEDGVQSTDKAEKKGQKNEQVEKQLEVQVVSTQTTPESRSSEGIPETPLTQW